MDWCTIDSSLFDAMKWSYSHFMRLPDTDCFLLSFGFSNSVFCLTFIFSLTRRVHWARLGHKKQNVLPARFCWFVIVSAPVVLFWKYILSAVPVSDFLPG